MRLQEQRTRLKEFRLNDERRQLQQLRATILEFRRIVADLEKQIAIEERQVGIYDKDHFAYPILAKSARQRIDNLLLSIRDLLLRQESLESHLESESNSDKSVS
ncbi:hypothetical protein Q7M76_03865 [Candidatus Liberibacter asiaticus]|uniref:Uncharacterized protein n=2 Tax=Liberibacter asiaticus TaxID=34021 RepID=C6XG64_LIBAP|nr:hypothetical protein [Candidatus Liberibacter asiaticus]ACT57367.1 hypothetical protein CLIBASIA_03955 [Candidatus Liberibacter asiaticus str. psy62]AGH17128.1 hypothetical protein WSI_03790 [Candidatus Liberibacter asiaticus str. gxpsy]ALK07440.1 hypothetical protein CD16_03880 [Candidatus Liberibacter asiaticus]ASK52932.1 hypothetical protein B2I23_03935 [Candidatus Liberibacter asiaticus]AWL14253.1 hypothetical protein DIC79_03960 [Candidatus Liberibacter asiaticus]